MADVSDACVMVRLSPMTCPSAGPSLVYVSGICLKVCDNGLRCQWNDGILPCLRVLPMGWSWRLRFCQQHIHDVAGSKSLIRDRHPGQVVDSEIDCIGCTYVDNCGVLSCSALAANRALSAANASLEQTGLIVHEVQSAATVQDIVDLFLKGNRLSIIRSRIWRIRLSLQYILHRDCASGAALEVVVGHITWIHMVRRQGLSGLVLCV